MPAYNAENTIAESIDSVLKQSFHNFELIICDDSSTDRTVEIINTCSKHDQRIKLINNSFERGAAGARNSCIKSATGRYIAFLDSDDLWLPGKLKTQYEFMKLNSLAISHGAYEMFDEKGLNKLVCPPKVINYKNLLMKCDIGCLTVMLDRTMFKDVNFPSSPKEDYAFWITLTKESGKSSFCFDGVMAKYRKQPASLSSSKFDEIPKQWHVLRKVANISFLPAVYYLFTYCMNGILKHKF